MRARWQSHSAPRTSRSSLNCQEMALECSKTSLDKDGAWLYRTETSIRVSEWNKINTHIKRSLLLKEHLTEKWQNDILLAVESKDPCLPQCDQQWSACSCRIPAPASRLRQQENPLPHCTAVKTSYFWDKCHLDAYHVSCSCFLLLECIIFFIFLFGSKTHVKTYPQEHRCAFFCAWKVSESCRN